MRIENEILLDFDDVLIRPKRSTLNSRNDVDLVRKFTYRNSGLDYVGIPIMAANMDGVGTFKMAEKLIDHKLFTCLRKHYTIQDIEAWQKKWPHNKNGWAMSIGAKDEDLLKYVEMNNILKDFSNYVCIDVANGYHEKFINFIKKFREKFPYKVIIAGNVATAEVTEELILSGADIVKIGIGPGSVCTTRLVTGVGVPQFSAIIECADAAHGLKGHIIADGGCRTPGDVSKAFAAGADFVMLGGMLAGHDEGLSNLDEIYGNTVSFYGMSSKEAQEKHNGGKSSYRASEGKIVNVKYKGPVSNTIEEILGGLRSTCTYVGAASLKELTKRATFVRVNNTHNKIFEGK